MKIPAFFKKHRGGSGCVIVAAVQSKNGEDEFGIFSCIENAVRLVETFPDRETSIISPHVVDVPEWGNAEAIQ